MTNVAPMNPVKILLLLKGVHRAMMMKHPPKTPDPPTPAIARPMIKATEEDAVAQTRLPTINIIIEDMNVHFVLSKAYARPYGS